jgi:Na+(H+)/acetate symporter ActP
VAGFRAGALIAVVVPASLSLLTVKVGLADTVGLAFALAASTFCPLLVLGIWWRRLTVHGALAGLGSGGVLASAAVVVTMVGVQVPGLAGVLLAQPAAWTVPVAFAVTILVSLATPASTPVDVRRVMVRLHAPEGLGAGRVPDQGADVGLAVPTWVKLAE